jgi:hypothetical protein
MALSSTSLENYENRFKLNYDFDSDDFEIDGVKAEKNEYYENVPESQRDYDSDKDPVI